MRSSGPGQLSFGACALSGPYTVDAATRGIPVIYLAYLYSMVYHTHALALLCSHLKGLLCVRYGAQGAELRDR